MTNWTANGRALERYHRQRKEGANTRYIRCHSSDDMAGLGEFRDVTEPVAVVLRNDGSVDVYGYIAVVDQRPGFTAGEAPRLPAADDGGPGELDQAAADLAANAAAAFDPGADPARRADGDHSLYPAVVIGGAMVFAYAEDGVLTVSVDLDDALSGESPVWGAYGDAGGRLVPVRVSVQGTEVFSAVPGEGPVPVPADCQDHGGPPHRHDSDGEPCL